MRRTIAMLTAAGLMLPLAAHALNERVWLTLNGGGGTYVMSDLNSEIDAFNTANAGSGWSFPHVSDGRSLGGSVGYETLGQWNFGLGYERLDATTRAGDASGSLEYRLGANAWRLFGEYSLRPIGHSGVALGGALGVMQESGKIIETDPGGGPIEFHTSGSSPSFEGYAGGNLWLGPRLAVTTNVGYRYGKVKQIRVEGYPFLKTNGEPMSLDFTGPYVRLGIKIAARGSDD